MKDKEIAKLRSELDKAKNKNNMLNVYLRQNDDYRKNNFNDIDFSYWLSYLLL